MPESLYSLGYKRNLDDTLDRLTALHERRALDRVLATFSIPSQAIDQFAVQYSHGFCDYPDPEERLHFWDDYLGERQALEDDSIPCAYLSEFDQGLYGGVLRGEVQLMAHPETGWISSMVAPLLGEMAGLNALTTDRDGLWYQRYLRQMTVFVEGAAGRFGISHIILIDGLNFCFELIGATATYEALLDDPDWVHRAVTFGYALNLDIQRTFFEHVPLLRGGTCSNMAGWLPGRVISESVDPFHMTSVDYFETWGREPVQRIFDQFDGGVLHLHGNGRHLLEAVNSLRGLRTVYLGDDRGWPPSMEVLPSLRERAPDLPFVLDVDYATFCEALDAHALVGGVLYRVSDAPGTDDASRLMEVVRAYRC